MTDLTGKVFGQLTVVARGEKKHGHWLWECRCECGGSARADTYRLRSGHTRSCGCLVGSKQRTHGLSRSPEYRIWWDMRRRCHQETNQAFQYYGARGIQVCDAWRNSFEQFLSDMGKRPSNEHTLDRIDNDGNYEPGNCRWATRSEQAKNRRGNVVLEHAGERLIMRDWARRIGISNSGLEHRLKHMSVADALTAPCTRRVS